MRLPPTATVFRARVFEGVFFLFRFHFLSSSLIFLKGGFQESQPERDSCVESMVIHVLYL